MSSQPQRSGNRNLDSYVNVHTRVEKFRTDHPNARLTTVVLKDEPLTVRCEIFLDGNTSEIPNSSGMADESGGMGGRGNSTLEKVETAAVGRALAFLGYEVKEGIASREEVEKPPLRVVQQQESPKAIQERTARAKGLVSRGLVTKEADGYSVTDGAIRDPQTHLVTRDATGQVVCTCPDFKERPQVKCVHILAVKEFVIAQQPKQPEEDAKNTSKLRERIYREFAHLGYSAEDIGEYMRKNEEFHGGTVLEVMSFEQLQKVAEGLEIK
jgi:hypothetical protein